MTKEKIHPYKFSMWLGIASIIMMFAGLTSAYIVRSSQAKWTNISLPPLFFISTIAIFASSISLHFSIKQFKNRNRKKHLQLFSITIFLAIIFMTCQIIAFYKMFQQGITPQNNIAAAFLYMIVGLHLLHIFGGVIALMVVYIKQNNKHTLLYSSINLEVCAIYWHFVDVLWIYLILFFLITKAMN